MIAASGFDPSRYVVVNTMPFLLFGYRIRDKGLERRKEVEKVGKKEANEVEKKQLGLPCHAIPFNFQMYF